MSKTIDEPDQSKAVLAALYSKAPQFTTLEEFALFVYHLHGHVRAPGLGSSTARFVEVEKLGTTVDTSPVHEDRLVASGALHARWVGRLLREVVEAQSRRDVAIWYEVDAAQRPQVEIADEMDLTPRHVRNILYRVRDELKERLQNTGRM